MLGITHLLFALAVVYILELPVVYGMIGGVLPDIDGAFSFGFPFGHRGIVHTPVTIAVVMGVVYLAAGRRSPALALGAGMLTHLFLDTLTPSGIMWLYPVTTTFSLDLAGYNSFVANIGIAAFAVGMILLWRYQFEVSAWVR